MIKKGNTFLKLKPPADAAASGFSAASFLVHVIDSGKIVDPGFDPMDYIPPDYDIAEDEFE